jgi:hypothetical protein
MWLLLYKHIQTFLLHNYIPIFKSQKILMEATSGDIIL